MFKIAYIIGDLNIGGWPTYLLNLTSELRNEFDFYFIATENSNINSKFHEIGSAKYFGNNKNNITKYLSTIKPDIVQFGNQDFGRLAKNAGTPIVIERTAGPRSCNGSHDGVDHIIASNSGTLDLIKFNGPITMIKNGLDIDKFNSVIPNRLGFSDNDFIICYCARIGGVGQGHDTLIRSVIKARDTNKNIRLVFIGDKPLHASEDIRPKLKKAAEPLGQSCVWLGETNDSAPIMLGADLYVCPALHHGISNSLIEAAALGRPIIATNVGQTNEIVFDGINGYLVSVNDISAMADKIIKLADSPNKRAKFGEVGKNIVARDFNIKVQAKKHIDLYNSLLSSIHN